MTDEVLQHLIRGWGGLVNIVAKVTETGFRLPDDELKILEDHYEKMATVIRKQRAMR